MASVDSVDPVEELAKAIESGLEIKNELLKKYWEVKTAKDNRNSSERVKKGSGNAPNTTNRDVIQELQIATHKDHMRASKSPWKVKKNDVNNTVEFEFGIPQPTIHPNYTPSYSALSKKKTKVRAEKLSSPSAESVAQPDDVVPRATNEKTIQNTGHANVSSDVSLVDSHTGQEKRELQLEREIALRALMIVLGVHLNNIRLARSVSWGNKIAHGAYRRELVQNVKITKFVTLNTMMGSWSLCSSYSPSAVAAPLTATSFYQALTSFSMVDASAIPEDIGHALGACKTLRELVLCRNDLLTSDALGRLLASFHCLQRLELENFAQMQNMNFIFSLRSPSSLLSLAVRRCQGVVGFSSDVGVSKLSEFNSLQMLDLSHCPRLDSEILACFAQHCPSITNLNLQGCDWLSDGDALILRSMQQLELLTLPGLNLQATTKNQPEGKGEEIRIQKRTGEGFFILTYVNEATINYMLTSAESIPENLPPVVRFYFYNVLCQRRFTLSDQLDACMDNSITLSYLTRIDCSTPADRTPAVVDLLLFESLTALYELVLDGCRLCVSFHDVDASYAELVDAAFEDGTEPSQKLVDIFFPQVVRSTGYTAPWKRHLTAKIISIARCSLVSTRPRLLRQRSPAEAGGIIVHWDPTMGTEYTADPIRRNVVAEHKFLFLKHLTSSQHTGSNFPPSSSFEPNPDPNQASPQEKFPVQMPNTPEQYGECSGVTSINLSHSPLVDASSLRYLAAWLAPSLAVLNISHGSKVDDDALKVFATTLQTFYRDDANCQKKFRSLDISSCLSLTNDGIRKFCTLTQQFLLELNIARCSQLTNSSMNMLPRTLQTLDISGCSSMGAVALETIAERCSKTLRKLFMDHCDLVTDHAVTKILPQFSALTHLSLRGCCRMQDSSLAQFFGTIPASQPFVFLNIRDTDAISVKMVAYIVYAASQRSPSTEILC
jgi:hypothetical protein